MYMKLIWRIWEGHSLLPWWALQVSFGDGLNQRWAPKVTVSIKSLSFEGWGSADFMVSGFWFLALQNKNCGLSQ